MKGIDIVGELPQGAQQITVFAAGIPITSTQPDAARTLIQWLRRAALYDAIRRTGLEPVKSRPVKSR